MMDTHNLQFAAFLCWLYAALLASVKQKRLKAVWEIGIWESLITKHKSRPKGQQFDVRIVSFLHKRHNFPGSKQVPSFLASCML